MVQRSPLMENDEQPSDHSVPLKASLTLNDDAQKKFVININCADNYMSEFLDWQWLEHSDGKVLLLPTVKRNLQGGMEDHLIYSTKFSGQSLKDIPYMDLWQRRQHEEVCLPAAMERTK